MMSSKFEICQKCARLYESGGSCDRCAGGRVMAMPKRQAAPAPVKAAAPSEPELTSLADTSLDEMPTVVKPMPAKAASSPTVAEGQRVGPVSFHGTGGGLLGIQIVNMLLMMVTLGLYAAWGKVRVRKYLLSQTEFEGDRFAYHGTGWELFKGMIKGGFAIGLWFALPRALSALGLGPAFDIAVFVVVYGMLLIVIPMAIIGARRYRLSRTSWREIRFSLRASTGDFIKLFIKGFLLTALTLGFYYPIFLTQRFGFLAAYSYFGNRKFEFDGQGRELMKSYVVSTLLLIPTLGLSMIWWAAAKRRYLWSHVSIEGLRLRCDLTGGALFKFYAVNALLLLVTMGLAWPWISVRNLRFTYENISFDGAINLASVTQEARSADSLGDGLDSALELDTGLAA